MEILLVEDCAGDVRIMREVFRSINPTVHINVVTDGLQALAFLRQEGAHVDAPRPGLILLDLNLPGMDGREALAQIKADKRFLTIPIVVLTCSNAPADIDTSYQLASCHLLKPLQVDDFERLVRSINDFWLTRATLPSRGFEPPAGKEPGAEQVWPDDAPGRRVEST